MPISYEEFEQNTLEVLDDLAVQEELKKSFPSHPQEGISYGFRVKYMPFEHHIKSWRVDIECGEAEIAYESIVSLINNCSCHLKGRNVIKLIEVALFLNDYIDYKFIFNKPVSFTDDKKMVLSDEELDCYLLDVIDDFSGQAELSESFITQNNNLDDLLSSLKTLVENKGGVLVYETIIGLLYKYPCKLNGKNVVNLIQVALSLGNDIDYEHILKK